MADILSVFIRLCFCFASFAITFSEGNEDSLRLAWAVRRLVGNCSRGENYSQRYGPRIGKTGPPGPKGDPGECDCDRGREQKTELKLRQLEEAFCLLGMKSGEIPDGAISVSSIHAAGYCTITNSRLDRPGGWCVATNNPPSQWIEVDLGRVRNVTGIVTQGQGKATLYEWVTAFKIAYGTMPGSRRDLLENGNQKVFSPVNFDGITKVVTRFPNPVTARYIRLVPTAYQGHMTMRIDFIDC